MPRFTVTMLGLLFVSLLAQAQQSNSSSTVSSPLQTVVVTSIPLTVGVILGTTVTGPSFLAYCAYVVVPWQYLEATISIRF